MNVKRCSVSWGLLRAVRAAYQGCLAACSQVYLLLGSFSIKFRMKSLAAKKKKIIESSRVGAQFCCHTMSQQHWSGYQVPSGHSTRKWPWVICHLLVEIEPKWLRTKSKLFSVPDKSWRHLLLQVYLGVGWITQSQKSTALPAPGSLVSHVLHLLGGLNAATCTGCAECRGRRSDATWEELHSAHSSSHTHGQLWGHVAYLRGIQQGKWTAWSRRQCVFNWHYNGRNGDCSVACVQQFQDSVAEGATAKPNMAGKSLCWFRWWTFPQEAEGSASRPSYFLWKSLLV